MKFTENELKEYIKSKTELMLFVELNLLNFHPWVFIIEDQRLYLNYVGLMERFPNANLIAFALRLDCDDKVCYDLNENKIVVVHDYSTFGYKNRMIFDSFWDWFNFMTKEFIEFHTIP